MKNSASAVSDVPVSDPVIVGEGPTEASVEAHTPGWRERGASLVEYALLVALIALVAMAGVQVMGGAVGSAIDDGASSLQTAGE